jgi:hypothetical protein
MLEVIGMKNITTCMGRNAQLNVPSETNNPFNDLDLLLHGTQGDLWSLNGMSFVEK